MTLSRVALVLAVALAQLPARDSAAPPRIASAVISGTIVTNDADPQPIRRARITLNGDIKTDGQVATSDDAGRFVFRAIPAGRYALQATKPPFLPMNYGASRPDRLGTAVAVADGQTISGLVIRMTRGAAIEGRVLDPSGEPMPGVPVTAMRNGFAPLTGERAWTAIPAVVTDDRGIYRAFGLTPGEYIVVVRSPPPNDGGRGGTAAAETRKLTAADVDRVLQSAASPAPPRATIGSVVNWSPVYYPGSSDIASAARITLAAGEDQTGVDVSMRLMPTSRISGIVTMPEGIEPASVQMTITAADPQARGSGSLGFVSSTRPAAGGRYLFSGVTPGSFIVNARTGLAAAGRGAIAQGTAGPMLWAAAPVAVQGSDLDVPLTLRPGVPVSGRVEFKTATPLTPDETAGIRILLRAVDNGPGGTYQPSARIADQNRFAFEGVVPGSFHFSWTPGAGRELFPTSVTIGGREVLDAPITIGTPIADMTVTLTDRPSEITGRLQDATGRAAADYFIVVFSTNRAFWTPLSRRVKQTRPGSDGGYSVRNLPAGEYFLAALTDLAPGDTSDPLFLAGLAATAAKVTVRDGATTVQAFRIGG